MIFLTRAQDAVVSPYGWAQLPSGVWVTRLPLLDIANAPMFAHLDYDTLTEVCERLGAKMLRPETVVELNRFGLRLRPVIISPDASDIETCKRHDNGAWGQLAALEYAGALPVANIGKPWVQGAQPGRSRLFGWSKNATAHLMGPQDFSDWYQPLQNAHNRKHVDYSACQTIERERTQ